MASNLACAPLIYRGPFQAVQGALHREYPTYPKIEPGVFGM